MFKTIQNRKGTEVSESRTGGKTYNKLCMFPTLEPISCKKKKKKKKNPNQYQLSKYFSLSFFST